MIVLLVCDFQRCLIHAHDTIYKRFNFYKGARSRLIATLYRDGMIYMTCITMVSFTNIVITLVVPATYTNILDASVYSFVSQVLLLTSLGPQLVIHGVLASRILFNLRCESQSEAIDGSLPLADIYRTPGDNSIVFVNTNQGMEG
ncbi:hypothetical protein BDR07DRAFT_1433667 [Suillus spraguei]|nr:hypothetical protein BDR07DRAFT_1433667 [Suillus spraguei]